MKSKVAMSCSAILSAFNEEYTVLGVIRALLDSLLVDEIVVVDDGSTDGTAGVIRGIAEDPQVNAIYLPQNHGKGFAMAEGIQQAEGEVLLFVDADLLNLRPGHIFQILNGILDQEADMVIGYPSRGQGLMAVNLFKPFAGQRALFREDILPLVESLKSSRYGVETLINLYYRCESKRVQYVPLPGLFHPMKLEVVGPKKALGSYAREAFQIGHSIIQNYTLTLAALGLDLPSSQDWRGLLSMPLSKKLLWRLKTNANERLWNAGDGRNQTPSVLPTDTTTKSEHLRESYDEIG